MSLTRTPGAFGSLWLSVALLSLGCGAHAASPASPGEPVPLTREQVHMLPGAGPVVELRLSFRVGSVDDPVGREGLTALTARVMAEGGAGRWSYVRRQRLLYPMAAEIGVEIARQQTTFVARVHRDHVMTFYPMWLATLRQPAFWPDDLARLREQQRAELVQGLRGTDDEALGKALLQQMLYVDHPYRHPVQGTEAGLDAITPADLQAHWQRFFCAERLQLAVTGGLPAGFVDRLRVDLGTLRTATCEAALPSLPAPTAAPEQVWIAHKPEARSVAVSMGLHVQVNRAHPDYPALMLAAAYLGQHRTFAGVLMQTIRSERGLNYGDYAYAEHFEQYRESAFPRPNVARAQQYFSLWLRPLAPEHVHFAIRAAKRELDELLAGEVTVEAFERIQRFADGYFALFAQTHQLAMGNALDEAFYDTPPGSTLDGLRAGMRALSRDAWLEAVRRHVDPVRLRIALVAPDADGLARALVEGAPSPMRYEMPVSGEVLAEDAEIESYPLDLRADAIRIVEASTLFAR